MHLRPCLVAGQVRFATILSCVGDLRAPESARLHARGAPEKQRPSWAMPRATLRGPAVPTCACCAPVLIWNLYTDAHGFPPSHAGLPQPLISQALEADSGGPAEELLRGRRRRSILPSLPTPCLQGGGWRRTRNVCRSPSCRPAAPPKWPLTRRGRWTASSDSRKLARALRVTSSCPSIRSAECELR